MQTQYTALEQAALDQMLAESIREKNADLYRKLVNGSDEQIQDLLDCFFR